LLNHAKNLFDSNSQKIHVYLKNAVIGYTRLSSIFYEIVISFTQTKIELWCCLDSKCRKQINPNQVKWDKSNIDQ
jgi:hypothetical protein